MEEMRMEKYKYDFEIEKYYVEWAMGLNRKEFGTIEEAIDFAESIKDKDSSIHQIRRVICQ